MDLKKIEQRLSGVLQTLENANKSDDGIRITGDELQALCEQLQAAIKEVLLHQCPGPSKDDPHLIEEEDVDDDDKDETYLPDLVETQLDVDDYSPKRGRKRHKKHFYTEDEEDNDHQQYPGYEDFDGNGEDEHVLAVSPELKGLILWVNDLPSCYLKNEKPLPTDFDVLRGRKLDYYDFYSSSSWRQQLALLLLRLPHFRHHHYLFFAQLFQQTPRIWQQKLTAYEKLFLNEPMTKHNWQYCPKDKDFVANVLQPILKGNVDYGFTEDELASLAMAQEVDRARTMQQQAEDGGGGETQNVLDELTGELIANRPMNPPTTTPLRKKRRLAAASTIQVQPSTSDDHHFMAVKLENNGDESNNSHSMMMMIDDGNSVGANDDAADGDNEAKEGSWIAEIPPGETIRARLLKTYRSMAYYGYKRFILPELRTRLCAGLLALHVDPDGEAPARARILVRHEQSRFSHPERELMNLVGMLTEVCGMSQRAAYKWNEMVPKNDGYSYRKLMVKKDRRAMLNTDLDFRKKKLEEAKAAFTKFEVKKPPNEIIEIPGAPNDWVDVEIVEHMAWSEVNNVSVLLNGDKPDNYMLKTLFNEECLKKFVQEVEACKTQPAQKLSNSQFCRTMFEIFKLLTSTESKEMVVKYPSFGRTFNEIRRSWNLMKDLEDMQTMTSKMCDHCGKVFQCHTTKMDGESYMLHIKKCRLEKASCNCGLIFSSPREKRHHMLLLHSGVKYLECTQCHYLTQKQEALDNHIEYFHGFPGRVEVCDLCNKSCKSRYHLSIHQFTHENHWCAPCQREFIGRLPFRNHMKNQHGAGFMCQLCGRIMATKIELEKHKKLTHDKSWMSS